MEKAGKPRLLSGKHNLFLRRILVIDAVKREIHIFLETLRHRKWALSYLIILTFSSTVIFSDVEHRSLFDSFYWTITVLSTVGFGDITPHVVLTKMLFIVLAISGITTYIYLITSWQTSVIEARLERKLWELADADYENRRRKSKANLFRDQPKNNKPSDQP